MLAFNLFPSHAWQVVGALFVADSADTDLAHLVISAVVTSLGALGSLFGSLKVFSESRSLLIQSREEAARAAELKDLLAEAPEQDTPQSAATREQLQADLQSTREHLSQLTERISKLQKDPNYDLTLLDRLFLSFRSAPPFAIRIRGLAYLSLAGGLVSILLLRVRFGVTNTGLYADVVILTIYSILAFRAWALAERRWRNGYESPPGLFSSTLVLKRPVNRKMLVAQICLWSCLFCAVESLEDVTFGLVKSRQTTTGQDTNAALRQESESTTDNTAPDPSGAEYAESGLNLFLISLLGAGVCARWASAEAKHAGQGNRDFWASIFPGSGVKHLWAPIFYLVPPGLSSWLLAAAYGQFDDRFDKAELIFICVALTVGGIRLINLWAQRGVRAGTGDQPVPVLPAA